jgi:hypothetical protein
VRILSANGLICLETSNWSISVTGRGIRDRKHFAAIGKVGLAAVTNNSLYVAVSPRGEKAVIVYHWNGRRWQAECDYDLDDFPAFIAWNEDAMVPELTVQLANGADLRIYSWSRCWFLTEAA